MKPNPRYRDVVLLPISRIIFSNGRPKKNVIRSIVEGFSSELFKPVCAFHQPDGFFITDGNHRTEALRQLGYSHVPAILLTKEEYDHIAFSKRYIDIIATIPDSIAVLE